MADAQPGNGHLERLQKIIAAAGVCSRRKAEELITEGRVQVNGQTVTELGTKADAAKDHIRVDGKLLQGLERHRYYLVNKPKGYVTTVSDPENRPTVMQIIQKGKRGGERVFPVGRLDYASEGLQLLTNDGELANALTRASSKVEKTYLVKVSGKPAESSLDQIRSGMMIEKGRFGEHEGRVLTAPARIRMVRDAENPWYEMVLIEGRNREIRKMFEEIGHHVEKIRRVGYGPLVLDVEPGEFRELSEDEVEKLTRASRATKPRKPAKVPERPAKSDAAVKILKIKKGPGGRPSSPVRRRASKASRPGFKVKTK
jgi:23S rRNA pseudouridine2605 synthase